jgi:hypothetical protein
MYIYIYRHICTVYVDIYIYILYILETYHHFGTNPEIYLGMGNITLYQHQNSWDLWMFITPKMEKWYL